MTSLGNFTDQAEAYHLARPGYSEALLDRLMALADVRSGDAVADLGAGTGIFTRMLAARGLTVTALEPNEKMRTQAATMPGVRWGAGTFEATMLPDHSQDWIVAAQAFHWADSTRALPELHRCLKPGRCLTVLWNDRLNDQSPMLAETWALIQRNVPRFDDNYRSADWSTVLTSTGHFHDVCRDQQQHVVVMNRQRFVNLWRSHNRLTVQAGPAKMRQLIGEIEKQLVAANVMEIPVPYLCRSWTARRVD